MSRILDFAPKYLPHPLLLKLVFLVELEAGRLGEPRGVDSCWKVTSHILGCRDSEVVEAAERHAVESLHGLSVGGDRGQHFAGAQPPDSMFLVIESELQQPIIPGDELLQGTHE